MGGAKFLIMMIIKEGETNQKKRMIDRKNMRIDSKINK